VKRAFLLTGAVVLAAGVIANADTPPPPPSDPAAAELACVAEPEQPKPAPAEQVEADLPLDRVEFPTAHTPPPEPRDWHKGRAVALTREDSQCAARVVREWMFIECTRSSIESIELLAGDRTGVDMRLARESADGSFASAQIVFPVRPRDRRVFQIVPLGSEWDDEGEGPSPTFVSESWIDGEPPRIVVATD
jgi:hypothetical protein